LTLSKAVRLKTSVKYQKKRLNKNRIIRLLYAHKTLTNAYLVKETGLSCWKGAHEQDWIRACKESPESRVESSSNFNYSGPLNEMVVMGVVAVRLQDLNRELIWNGEKMEFENISDTDEIRVVTSDKFEVIDGHPHFDTKHDTLNALNAAKEYIKHTYRDGWALPEMPG